MPDPRAGLVPEEERLLEILVEQKLVRESLPYGARSIVVRPEKYAWPIGLDAQGEPFPPLPRRDVH